MNHPSEGVLQAFLDGELAAPERERVAGHVGGCPVCGAELEELRSAAARFSSAMRLGDVAPDVAAARTAIQQRPARPVLRLLPTRSARTVEVRRALMRAAVLVLLAAGAASAAIPGGPVRRFFVALWNQTTRFFTGRPATPTPVARKAPSGAPAPVAPPAGVSVMPYDGQIRIVVHEPARGLRVRVRVVDADRASVEASGGAATARFTTGPGRIEVTGGGTGDLRIGLPRAAQHATLEIGGKPVLSKDGGQLRHFVPIEHAGGETLIQVRP